MLDPSFVFRLADVVLVTISSRISILKHSRLFKSIEDGQSDNGSVVAMHSPVKRANNAIARICNEQESLLLLAEDQVSSGHWMMGSEMRANHH